MSTGIAVVRADVAQAGHSLADYTADYRQAAARS